MHVKLDLLREPSAGKAILVCGLPGIAYVGKLTSEYLIQELHTELIGELHSGFGIRIDGEGCGPLLFAGTVASDAVEKLSAQVEQRFGKPYKPAGQGAFFKNYFDGFVKAAGGIRKEQTLYRKDISPTLTLYCALWPWGSNPIKTTVRIGLLCGSSAEEHAMEKALRGSF